MRVCRVVSWVAPTAAGLAVAVVFAGAERHGIAVVGWPWPLFFMTVFAGAAIAAYAVARLHPVEQGKWRRAGHAFLFGVILAWIAAAVARVAFWAFDPPA